MTVDPCEEGVFIWVNRDRPGKVGDVEGWEDDWAELWKGFEETGELIARWVCLSHASTHDRAAMTEVLRLLLKGEADSLDHAARRAGLGPGLAAGWFGRFVDEVLAPVAAAKKKAAGLVAEGEDVPDGLAADAGLIPDGDVTALAEMLERIGWQRTTLYPPKADSP